MVDVLSRTSVRAKEVGLVDEFVIGRDSFCVSHLQFVNDTISLSYCEESKVVNLPFVLRIF